MSQCVLIAWNPSSPSPDHCTATWDFWTAAELLYVRHASNICPQRCGINPLKSNKVQFKNQFASFDNAVSNVKQGSSAECQIGFLCAKTVTRIHLFSFCKVPDPTAPMRITSVAYNFTCIYHNASDKWYHECIEK